jgi:uncharacterized protein
MYIETKEIDSDGISFERTLSYALPPAGKVEDEVRLGPVHLRGELQKEGSRVAFAGDIQVVAELSCSRCLELYARPLDLHFDLLYTAEPEKVEKGESRVDEASITEVHYDGARIDLDALLGEQILLGLPLKPLCREDCRGLCPQCGANRNAEACGCSVEPEVDPRFAALKKLKTT